MRHIQIHTKVCHRVRQGMWAMNANHSTVSQTGIAMSVLVNSGAHAIALCNSGCNPPRTLTSNFLAPKHQKDMKLLVYIPRTSKNV